MPRVDVRGQLELRGREFAPFEPAAEESLGRPRRVADRFPGLRQMPLALSVLAALLTGGAGGWFLNPDLWTAGPAMAIASVAPAAGGGGATTTEIAAATVDPAPARADDRAAALSPGPGLASTLHMSAAAPLAASKLPDGEARLPVIAPELQALPAARPQWEHNAVAALDTAGRPMIAIVIDDLGLNRINSNRVAGLPGPLTLAYMTYAPEVDRQARAARAAGHELLVHVPMEPMDGNLNTGPNALLPELPAAELERRIDWALSRFDGYVGVNNHMGSRFTSNPAAMSLLLAKLHGRGLLFLDSMTIASSVGGRVAAAERIPFARRDVFLDNETNADAVWLQLLRTEAVARRQGFAIAIGHPHDGTIAALARWLPTLEDRGFVLVPISQIVRRNRAAEIQTAQRAESSNAVRSPAIPF